MAIVIYRKNTDPSTYKYKKVMEKLFFRKF